MEGGGRERRRRSDESRRGRLRRPRRRRRFFLFRFFFFLFVNVDDSRGTSTRGEHRLEGRVPPGLWRSTFSFFFVCC